MKKKQTKQLSRDLNFDAFRWCIENDFQVYVKPVTVKSSSTGVDIPTGKFKIAVRRKGITTEGRDYAKVNGRYVKSKETFSDLTFNSQKDAFDHLNYVYEHLKNNYGR